MLSNAFKGAYTNQVTQKTQGVSAMSQGVKDVATVAAGAAGFLGALGTGAIAKGAQHALAGRIGGVGGNIMLASIQAKKDTTSFNKSNNFNMTPEQMDIESGNYNKQVQTAFETLQSSQQSDIMNRKGNIQSSLGEIDPNSELGKKVIGGLENDNN